MKPRNKSKSPRDSKRFKDSAEKSLNRFESLGAPIRFMGRSWNPLRVCNFTIAPPSFRILALAIAVAMACLLAGAVGLRAADGEASVKLTGIAHFDNRSRALLEIVPRPGRPLIRPILAEGERVEGVEVREIDEKTGRVRVLNGGVETFYVVDAAEPAAAGRTFNFKSADGLQVLEIYQELSQRTVLRPYNLAGTKLDLQTKRLSEAEALRALEHVFLAKGITTEPRGEKFVFAVRTAQTNRLSFIADPPATSSGGEIFPAGLIKFQDADLSQVLEIYQELTGRTVLKPSSLVGAKVSLRTQTELTRTEAIWVLDAALGLADVAMVPQGGKFVFALPGIENPQVPGFDPNPVPASVQTNDPFPAGLIKFQDADLAQVLSAYARLLGREPLPVAPIIPAVKMSVRTQTQLTRAEAVFALDALAAVNRLKFDLIEDNQVQVSLAAQARRESRRAAQPPN